jgi:hypothetical protein
VTVGALIFTVDYSCRFDVSPIAFQCAIFGLSLLVVPLVLTFSDMVMEGLLSHYFPSSVDILKQVLFACLECRSPLISVSSRNSATTL